jgi:hypothetical protein
MGELTPFATLQSRRDEGRANARLYEAGSILSHLHGGDTAGWTAILRFALMRLVADRGPLSARDVVEREMKWLHDDDRETA